MKPLIRPCSIAAKRDKVKAAIRAQADKIGPGAKLPTVVELCASLQVAKVTLHSALNELEVAGLIRRQRGSGIYVRERDDERPVGVLMEMDFSHPDVSFFWRRLPQQVRLLLASAGLRSRLYSGFRPPHESTSLSTCQEFIEDVAADRLRGVIVTWGRLSPEWAEPLRRRNVPLVGYGTEPGFEYAVDVDYAPMIRDATLRLLAAGRRKLALIDWTDGCLETFTATLAENSVPLCKQWVKRDFPSSVPGAGWAEFREIWTESQNKPDGLLVADDILFRGVKHAICELGIRVPDQLLVVTHANRGDNQYCPFPVWRFETDADAFAQAQVDLLLALLRRQPVAQHKIALPLLFVDSEGTTAESQPVAATVRTMLTEEASSQRERKP